MKTDLQREIEARLKGNLSCIALAAASGLRPDPRMLISEWAEKHRVLPEGSALPGPWRNATAPYLVEPMDVLSPDDPVSEVAIIKAAQSGGSAIAESWIGAIMHKTPAPIMYIQTTVKAAKDWKVEKLDETIRATDVLNPEKGGVVRPMKSRSGEGSTSERIRFQGGFLLLAGSNSAASLRQHSIRFMVRDDTSGWAEDADGEGDPEKLSEQRLKTYKAFGLSKSLDISTPGLKGKNIDRKYEASDKRRYYMACKGCGALNDWDWGDVKRNDAPPYRCHVICEVCETAHFEADKRTMLAPESGACWIPTAPDENGEVPPKTIPREEAERWRTRYTGRYRAGFHITGFMSVFELWDELAKLEDEAGDDPEMLKPFQNTSLGHAYEPKGEGPAWESLSARREGDWHRGVAPAGVLFATLSVDVQGDGLYWERVGWGPNKESWLIDHGFLAGYTDAPLEGAWPKLDQIVDQGFRHACGARCSDDLIGVDSGYHAEAAYAWTRRRHNALALKGQDGWSKLPIYRSESPEVQKTGLSAGKARKFGIRVWQVGTWGIKSTLMVYLSRTPREDRSGFPVGYCHFPADAEEEYFRQLVSEYVTTKKDRNGEVSRVWDKRGPNHWFDCRVYNWALTHFANLWGWSEAKWQERAAYYNDLAKEPGDMFGAMPSAVIAAPPISDAEDELPAGDETSGVKVKTGGAKRPPRDNGLSALANLNR
ncbi:phage terminase large subunit family protein [Stappia sp. F7233]|uniref:Phage terminase large subunit family protein n=1 Tax=Stappia albiluteola TaxID=2758565 RepID=A0A839AL36_9HYPH|nr:terminase gpA endonuclease subunit [Stappia albiluteola]MBA5779517.1 phage terminase large subunit family protein [Stappia albiluteola]